MVSVTSKAVAKKATAKKKTSAKKKANNTQVHEEAILTAATELEDLYKKQAALKKKMTPIAAAIKEQEEIIQHSSNELYGADDKVTIEGDELAVVLGARGKSTLVTDLVAALKMLDKVKKGLSTEIISLPIGKLKEYLNPIELDQVTETIQEGKRSIKIEPREG